MTLNVLIRKLECYAPLSKADRAALEAISAFPRLYRAKSDIIKIGDNPQDVHLIVEGLCCRYKLSETGERQIVAYLLPGDFCDLHVHILDEMDHSLGAITDCQVVDIPRSVIVQLLARPALARALWWATLVDEATLREWLVNVGSREADRRIAHLFCEIHARLSAIGLVDKGNFVMPITQTDLADTVGLSVVHVNRTLQVLRSGGMIAVDGSAIEIHDLPGLRAFCGFDPQYLHIKKFGFR